MNVIYKRIISAFLIGIAIICIISASGCGKTETGENEKLSIVTTLFPQYDFARQIAGERAEVTLLLKPGTEAHDYDPSASDMIKINNADLFIYMGEYMEPWAASIVDSIDNKKLNILDASGNITLLKSSDVHENEDAAYSKGEEHAHQYDPHIWTSPKNAVIMINNILEELISIDGENEQYYRENAEKYIERIEKIDSDIRQTVSQSKYDTIYFGGRFALLYFVEEYGLHYESAFDSCSSETEPSAKLVSHIIDEMKESGARTVYYEELSSTKTARTIADEVGGNILLLHSCHNVSSDEFKNGATYVSIMEQNVKNLKAGLN